MKQYYIQFFLLFYNNYIAIKQDFYSTQNPIFCVG